MLGMSADSNDAPRYAEEDIYEPHVSGIGRVLVARKGQALPVGYNVKPVTTDVTPKIVNKKVPKAPATKKRTPKESKD